MNQKPKELVQTYSLWSNPMVEAAKKSMKPEELERYNKIGESMFKDINFVEAKVVDEDEKYPEYVRDAIAYVSESLKSGLHPSMLSKEEVLVMQSFDGEEWYKKWGYVKEDLTEIFTVKKD